MQECMAPATDIAVLLMLQKVKQDMHADFTAPAVNIPMLLLISLQSAF